MKKIFLLMTLFTVLLFSCEKKEVEIEDDTSLPYVDDVCSVMEDLNFMRYCYDNFDVDKDKKVSMSEAKLATEINVNSMDIKSLKGIEYFKAITYLKCFNNRLKYLDVSKNSALTVLECTYNYDNLVYLDVCQNTALTHLFCFANALTSLDVSKSSELTHLYCNANNLTSLDISKNTALVDLDCFLNSLTSLDVSNNTALTRLSCGSNVLTSLDVSQNTALTHLYCGSNTLASLDVSKNTALTYLDCNNNNMSAEALNSLFESLPYNENGRILFFNNPGTATCDRSIYEVKGWKNVGG